MSQVLLRHEPSATNTNAWYSFTEEATLAVDHLRSTMGQNVFERKAPDRAVTQVAKRSWLDTAVAGEGRAKVRRTFLELSAAMQVMNARDGAPRPDGNATGNSALSGKTVEFVETDSGFVVRVPEGETAGELEPGTAGEPLDGPAPDLDALRRDCSLQGLLPAHGKAVSVGDEWPVDAAAMLGVFAPGGDIATYYGPIENQQDPDIVARFGGHAVSRFGAGVSGDVKATLTGTETRDSVRVARVEIDFDVQLSKDPAPWMRAQSALFEMALIGQSARNARHTMTVAGEGALLWDLDHHRFLEFTATAKATSDQKLDYAFEHRGFQYSGDEHFEFSGTTKLKLSANYEDR